MKVNKIIPMMQSGDVSVRATRGDLVWVRVKFPHKWCPALVLASNILGVQVSFSFFHHNENDDVSPTYFIESEVLPFEEAFPSLISRHNGDAPLLHSALRLLGQRLISGLRCRCLTGQAQARNESTSSSSSPEFEPAGVLGFVLDAAVSLWVEAPRFAHAVRVVAQVHAFRSYYSMKHKNMYKQNKNTGDNVKLLPSSSLGQKMHSVTQESVALEPKEKCQIISKNEESNLAIGAISPAYDPLYMVPEILKSERQSLLGLKNISDQGIVNICFGNSSTMSNYINKRKDNALGLCCRLPDTETIIFLNRKKRRLDKPASSRVFPQIFGVQESETNAYISKHTRPRISHVMMLEPERSIQNDNQASTCFCETSMNLTDEVQKGDSKRSQNCESLSNLALCVHSDKCKVDASAAKVKGMLGSDSSGYQERLQMSCNSDTTPLKLTKSARTELTSDEIQKVDSERSQNCELLSNLAHRIHSDKCEVDASAAKVKNMLGSDSSGYQERLQTSCNSDTTLLKSKRSARTELSSDEIQKVDSERSQNCESLSHLALRFHSDKFEVDASAAKVKSMLGSDTSDYHEKLQMRCNSDTTPLKLKRCAITEISSGDCLVEGKDCYQGVASCSTFNTKDGELSKTHVSFFPKSLYMKFPKNFNLPSKEQLIMKFSIFGSVDSSRTRVSCYAGSAQVVFLQEADALAAHRCAKKKVLFGEANNVRFWLDAFEHKRKGSASKQIGPPLKSCLKNSNSSRQKNREKHPKKVSFDEANVQFWLDHFGHKRRGFECSPQVPPPAIKQIGPPLKSCLKNCNSLKQENRKKHRRVRFTIVT